MQNYSINIVIILLKLDIINIKLFFIIIFIFSILFVNKGGIRNEKEADY